ncbi:MAG: PKD domain-containing protein [Chloroflexota bacterium]
MTKTDKQESEAPQEGASQRGSQRKAALLVGLACVAVVAVVFFLNSDRLLVHSDTASPQVPEAPNTEPVITGVSVSSDRMLPSGTCQITCEATDDDSDALSYSWEADKGEIVGEGPTIEWTAPDSEGLYRLSITVDDGHGGTVDYSTSLAVKANRQPQVEELSADAETIAPGDSTVISCEASDADGDRVTYDWSATGGEVFGDGDAIIWLAPEEPGAYAVEVSVRDPYGAESQRQIPMNVAESASPRLGRFSVKGIDTDMIDFLDGMWDVFRGHSIRITCHVVTGQEPYTYKWAVDYGTLLPEGKSAIWEAPHEQGPATVTVDVTDADGNTTRGTVLLYVETCACRF